MIRSIIISVNPDASCIMAEHNIIIENSLDENIDAINANKIFNHIHPDARLIDRVYELIDRKFEIFIAPFVRRVISAKIKNIRKIPPIPDDINKVRSYKINNINIGLAALSTAASFSKCTSIDTKQYGKYLKEAWIIAHKSYYLGIVLADKNYDKIYIFNGRHAISRPIAEILLSHSKSEINYYEFDYKRESYDLSINGFHDVKLIADKILAANISGQSEKYYNIISAGTLNTEYAKIQSSFNHNVLIKHNPKVKWVVFFTSSVDEFFAYYDSAKINDFFDSQFSIALYLAKNQTILNFKLIIRFHPNLQFKHESWKEEWNFDQLADLGATIIYPTDTLSSYKILDFCSSVVTVGSSIGFESINRGIPCIEIGNTIGSNMGVTVSGNDLEIINSFILSPWLHIDALKRSDIYGSYQVSPPFKKINFKGKNMTQIEIIKKVSRFKYFIGLLKKALLKNKFIEKIYSLSFNFYNRVYCTKIINDIDKKAPLKGLLADDGFLFYKAGDKNYNLNCLQLMTSNESIKIEKVQLELFNKVFDDVIPLSLDYLGPDLVIDSIAVTKVSSADYESVSANWHTDNVGHRLKIYLCIEGDGEIVTKYIPKSNLHKYFPNIKEDLRLIGKKNRVEKGGEIDIKHITGSLAVFDTNGLHRGAYLKESKCDRTILEIEIANKNKAIKLINRAPIGIRSGQNTFYIEKDFYMEFKYRDFLDEKRMRKYNDNYFIYGSTPSCYEFN
jgi:hypothetical protein